jgi:hypothetical protein
MVGERVTQGGLNHPRGQGMQEVTLDHAAATRSGDISPGVPPLLGLHSSSFYDSCQHASERQVLQLVAGEAATIPEAHA